ncbi:MAG: hypothetical protein R3Y33_01830 [Clostridia bacterium]
MYNIALVVLLFLVLYLFLAVVFGVPKLGIRKAYKKNNEKTGIITEIINSLSKLLSKKIKLSIMKRNKLESSLAIANNTLSPEEFQAQVYVKTALPLPLCLIFAYTSPILAIIPLAISIFLYKNTISELENEGKKRQNSIENELLKFVMYMSNALKVERNIITCIESYNKNFNTALTQELSYTIADMRTGNYEKALKNMNKRNNSYSISRLTRGLLSAMKGDNMSTYFDDLGYELSMRWEENLKAQALAKKPKIVAMSYIMFAVAIVTVFLILATALTSSNTLFGGI